MQYHSLLLTESVPAKIARHAAGCSAHRSVVAQVYTVSGGKSVPSWLSDKKKRSLKKDEAYRRRIELVQARRRSQARALVVGLGCKTSHGHVVELRPSASSAAVRIGLTWSKHGSFQLAVLVLLMLG